MSERKEEEAVIEFSARLAETFRGKVKEHNGSYPNKVNLGQVIKVYRHGAKSFPRNIEPDFCCINEWSMARVNMFIRMKQGNVPSSKSDARLNKDKLSGLIFETSSIKRVNSFLDLTQNWTPSEEDFELAKADVEKNQLNYNFKNIEEIYLTDESPSSRSIEIIY